jgi:hypothetical protein
MLPSWLQPSRASQKRPASTRLSLESLDERIVPAAHFNNASSSITNAGVLVASFKEAGLGDTVQIDYALTANANATYVYVNNGGNLPNSPQFTFVAGPVLGTGSFTSEKNGSITGTLTVQPPPAPQAFIDAAPNGLHVALFSVSYNTVTLTDTTNNIAVSLASQDSGQLVFPKNNH